MPEMDGEQSLWQINAPAEEQRGARFSFTLKRQ